MSQDRKLESIIKSHDVSSLLHAIRTVAEQDEVPIQATLHHDLKTADDNPAAIIKAVQKATKQLIQKEIKDHQAENIFHKVARWIQRKPNKPTFLAIIQSFLNDHLLNTVRTLMPEDNKWDDNDFKDACTVDAEAVDDALANQHIRFSYNEVIAKEDYTLRNPFFLAAMMYLWQYPPLWQHDPKKHVALFQIQMCFLQHLDLSRQGFQVKVNEVGEEKKLKIKIQSRATQRSCNFSEEVDFKRENITKNPYFPKDVHITNRAAIPAILSHLSEQQETYLINAWSDSDGFWELRNIYIHFCNPTPQPEIHLLYLAKLLYLYLNKDTDLVLLDGKRFRDSAREVLKVYEHLCIIDGNLLDYLNTISFAQQKDYSTIAVATCKRFFPDKKDGYYEMCLLLSSKNKPGVAFHPSQHGNLYNAIGKAIDNGVSQENIKNFITLWNNASDLVQEVVLSLIDYPQPLETSLKVGQLVESTLGCQGQRTYGDYSETMALILQAFKSTTLNEFETLFKQLPSTVAVKFAFYQNLNKSHKNTTAIVEFNRLFTQELDKSYTPLVADRLSKETSLIPVLSKLVSEYYGAFFAKNNLNNHLEQKEVTDRKLSRRRSYPSP